MATLSPPPRISSDSLRGLRSTIEDLRTERANIERFLEESFSEFEEMAVEFATLEQNIQQSRDELGRDQEAFNKERDRLQATVARCQELERLVAEQDQSLAAIRDELEGMRSSKQAVEEELSAALGDMTAAADLVEVVQTWSVELAAVAQRLRDRGASSESEVKPRLDKSAGAQATAPMRETERHSDDRTSSESSRSADAHDGAARESATESARARRPVTKAAKPVDPVVGSVLAQLAELEHVTNEGDEH